MPWIYPPAIMDSKGNHSMNVEQRLSIFSQTLLAMTLYVILLDIILPMGNLRPSRQDEVQSNSPLHSCLTVIRRYFLASKCSNWDPNAQTETAKSWQLQKNTPKYTNNTKVLCPIVHLPHIPLYWEYSLFPDANYLVKLQSPGTVFGFLQALHRLKYKGSYKTQH